MKHGVHHLTRVVVALVALTTAALAGGAYDFVDLNYEGTTFIQVFGTNEKGLVVGLAGLADDSGVGWVYDPKEQTFTDLPPLSGCSSLGAGGINDAGVIVGTCDSADMSEGFILKKGTYTRFAYPGYAFTCPRAISTTGLVTGYATATRTNDTSLPAVGFIYDPARGTFTDIAIPDIVIPGWSTSLGLTLPQGINALGRVVGNVFLTLTSADWTWGDSYGFVREPSGAVTLFKVNGHATRARGINDAGVIAGFTIVDDAFVGFVGTLPGLGGFQTMTDGELIAVPFPDARDTYIEAIDNTGRIVGQWNDASGGYHGYIATPVRKEHK